MPRYKLLHTVDVAFVAAPPAVAGAAPAVAASAIVVAKLDVTPEFVSADADGNFKFHVPAYSQSTHNVLSALHVALFEKTAAAPVPTIPSDPALIVASPLSFSAATPTAIAQVVTVDATSAPEGSYSAALVAEFAE